MNYFISSDPHPAILFRHSIWLLFWHSFLHFIWHTFWHSFWHMFWHSIWHSGLLSDIHSDILSDIMYVLPFYLACSVPSMWSWRYIGPRGAPQHPELDEEHRDPHLAGREKGIWPMDMSIWTTTWWTWWVNIGSWTATRTHGSKFNHCAFRREWPRWFLVRWRLSLWKMPWVTPNRHGQMAEIGYGLWVFLAGDVERDII